MLYLSPQAHSGVKQVHKVDNKQQDKQLRERIGHLHPVLRLREWRQVQCHNDPKLSSN